MHIQANRYDNVNNRHLAKPIVFKTRFSVPFKPKERREFLEENYWTIFGSGSLGAKAEELRNKAAAIEKAGFALYPRAVLAMGFFGSFRIRNGIYDAYAHGAKPEKLQKLVLDGQFSDKEMEILECIARYWMRTPLAIRSSAHGDSRGTGIYESAIISNCKDAEGNLEDVANAVKKVLASEFSRNAIAYRKDLSLPGGMAVMIEPVFGKEFTHTQGYTEEEEEMYGPAYSGIAYTGSKSSASKAFIAAGLPFEAVRGKSVEITDGAERSILSLEEQLSRGLMFEETKEKCRKLKILSEGEYVVLGESGRDGEAYTDRLKRMASDGVEVAPFRDWLFSKQRTWEIAQWAPLR